MKKLLILCSLFFAAPLWAAGQGEPRFIPRKVTKGWSATDRNLQQLWDDIAQTLLKNAQNPYASWSDAEKGKIDKWGKTAEATAKPLYDFLTQLYARYDSLPTKEMRIKLVETAQLTVPIVFGTGPLKTGPTQGAQPAGRAGGQQPITPEFKLKLLEIKGRLEADLSNGEGYKSNYERYKSSSDFAGEAKEQLADIQLLRTWILIEESKNKNSIKVDEKLSKDIDENVAKVTELLIKYESGGRTIPQGLAAFDASAIAVKKAIELIKKMIA